MDERNQKVIKAATSVTQRLSEFRNIKVYDAKTKIMIRKALQKYKETRSMLRLGKDYMYDDDRRRAFIEAYKKHLKSQEAAVAVWLHETHEEAATEENSNLRENRKIPFDSLPEEYKAVMLEMAHKILNS